MRPPNKSRSRNKNNRRNNNNNSGGNSLNRVYDSAGPDGRVRGTPVQVIEKYQSLAHDNSLAGDRVAMENFQQHAEHYIRLINEAQKQIVARREQLEAQQQQQNNNQPDRVSNGSQPLQNGSQQRGSQADNEQPRISEQKQDSTKRPEDISPTSAIDAVVAEDAPQPEAGLVETPEASATKERAKPAPRPRKPRAPKKKPSDDAPEVESTPVSD